MRSEQDQWFESQFGAALGSVVEILTTEVDGRTLRLEAPRVVEIAPDVEDRGLGLLMPGSILIFVLTDGHPLQAAIATAIERQDIAEIDAMAQVTIDRFRSASTGFSDSVQSVPHIAEVRYGSRSLAPSILLEENGGFAELFAYNGGPLDTGSFTVADRPASDGVGRLVPMVVVWAPQLSDLEREALAQVPAELSELNVSQGTLLPIPGWIRVAWAAYTISTFLYKEYRQWRARREQEGRLPLSQGVSMAGLEERLGSLPPEASARALLQARRDLMLRRGAPPPVGDTDAPEA